MPFIFCSLEICQCLPLYNSIKHTVCVWRKRNGSYLSPPSFLSFLACILRGSIKRVLQLPGTSPQRNTEKSGWPSFKIWCMEGLRQPWPITLPFQVCFTDWLGGPGCQLPVLGFLRGQREEKVRERGWLHRRDGLAGHRVRLGHGCLQGFLCSAWSREERKKERQSLSELKQYHCKRRGNK